MDVTYKVQTKIDYDLAPFIVLFVPLSSLVHIEKRKKKVSVNTIYKYIVSKCREICRYVLAFQIKLY